MIDPADVERFRADLHRVLPEGLRPGAPLALAVSGGPDSMAMLALAAAALPGQVIAATVDHGLRASAGDEAALVAATCADRGVPHATLAPDGPIAGGNLQARARDVRYALLGRWAVAAGARALATAHHGDDQAETVLMRAMRGSGPAGLAGVRARRDLTVDLGASIRPEARTLTIVRPLLGWRRAELHAVVTAAGIPHAEDPSNTDDRFDRARLRKALAAIDGLDPSRVARTAKAMADVEDALAWTTRTLAGAHCGFPEPGVAVLRPEPLPFELRRRFVALCLSFLNPAARQRGGDIAALVEALDRGGEGLLADVRCTVDRGAVPLTWRLTLAPPRRAHRPA